MNILQILDIIIGAIFVVLISYYLDGKSGAIASILAGIICGVLWSIV